MVYSVPTSWHNYVIVIIRRGCDGKPKQKPNASEAETRRADKADFWRKRENVRSNIQAQVEPKLKTEVSIQWVKIKLLRFIVLLWKTILFGKKDLLCSGKIKPFYHVHHKRYSLNWPTVVWPTLFAFFFFHFFFLFHKIQFELCALSFSTLLLARPSNYGSVINAFL